MHHAPWHLRHVRALLYAASVLSAVGVVVACALDDPVKPWIGARQLLGLWALGLLLASMLIGPLTAVWLILFALRHRGVRKDIGPLLAGFRKSPTP